MARVASPLPTRPEPTPALLAAFALLAILPFACAGVVGRSLPRVSFGLDELEAAHQAPRVQIDVLRREMHGDRTRVTLRARLRGEPRASADWLCLEPEWWEDGLRKKVDHEPNEYCGASVPDLSWTNPMDLFGSGVVGVNVALWNRASKQIASGHRDVVLGAEAIR